MTVRYVHVKWTGTGAEDMVPETSAPILAETGDLTILDPTPADWRAFKPRVPLGETVMTGEPAARPKRTRTPAATVQQVTEPAPEGATPEEATE